MAIALRLEHVDGLRLRQQLATAKRNNTKEGDNTILGGVDWHFEKVSGTHEDAVVPRDLDARTREPTNTYSPTINFGLKNLVIERKGPITHLEFRNTSVRNQLRIKTQTNVSTGRRTKDGADIKVWEDSGVPPQYLAPQLWGGVAVGDGTRVILDEMPT
jgi:hypothetical protein